MYRYVKSNDFIDDYESEYFDDLYDDGGVAEETSYAQESSYYEDEPTMSEMQQLREFYDTRIKGKNTYGVDGYEVYTYGHEMWKTLETKEKYTYLYDFMRSPEFVEVASKKFNVSPEQLVDIVNYSEAKDTYSDWYKDVYGFRPH